MSCINSIKKLLKSEFSVKTDLAAGGRFGLDAWHEVIWAAVRVVTVDLFSFWNHLCLCNWSFSFALRVTGVKRRDLLGGRVGWRFGLRKSIQDGRLLHIYEKWRGKTNDANCRLRKGAFNCFYHHAHYCLTNVYDLLLQLNLWNCYYLLDINSNVTTFKLQPCSCSSFGVTYNLHWVVPN